jgi:hypothetical protein
MLNKWYRGPADWPDDKVEEAIYMLRLGYTCGQVADAMRVFDEVITRLGWALRSAGVDVQGLVMPVKAILVLPPTPPGREPRLPAHIDAARRRQKALAVH